VRRFAVPAAVVLAVVGLFWSGRESTHGLGAFWEHWWCAMPVVAVALAVVLVASASIAGRRQHSGV